MMHDVIETLRADYRKITRALKDMPEMLAKMDALWDKALGAISDAETEAEQSVDQINAEMQGTEEELANARSAIKELLKAHEALKETEYGRCSEVIRRYKQQDFDCALDALREV